MDFSKNIWLGKWEGIIKAAGLCAKVEWKSFQLPFHVFSVVAIINCSKNDCTADMTKVLASFIRNVSDLNEYMDPPSWTKGS